MRTKALIAFLLIILSQCKVNAQDLIPIKKGAYCGYCDKDLNIVIGLDFLATFPFNQQGLAIVETSDRQFVVIDKTGNILPGFPKQPMDISIKQITDDVIVMDKGLYLLKEKKFLDCHTKFIYKFNEGYASYVSADNDKTGLMNSNGKKFLDGKFDYMGDLSEGLCFVRKNGKFGFIDISGKYIINADYTDFPGSFSDGLASVVIDKKVGYIDKSGNLVIPAIYDDIYYDRKAFRDGMATVSKSGKEGVIDTKGNEIIPIVYDEVFYLGEGVFEITQNKKHSLVNRSGQKITDVELETIGAFSEGYIRVQKNGKGSLMDAEGNFLIPFYMYVRNGFSNGYAEFSSNMAFYLADVDVCFIDKKGKVYAPYGIPFEYLTKEATNSLAQMDEVLRFYNYWIAKKDSKVEILDSAGNRVLQGAFKEYIPYYQYAVFKDEKDRFHFYDHKMDSITGPSAEKLKLEFTKRYQLKWYSAWNDSVPASRKTKTIRLGKYDWALDDLNVKTFRNGDSIPVAKSADEFIQATQLKKPAMLASASLAKQNGKPTTWYNQFAMNDKRGLIPKGYKIASMNEWQDLLDYAGGDSVAGEFLFKMGFTNQGIINEYASQQNLVCAWLNGEATRTDYIATVAASPVLGMKVNIASGLPTGGGIPIRCIKLEK